MRVLFLTNDLVFPSRVAGVVQRLGGRMETAGTAEALVANLEVGKDEPAVVLLDLSSSGTALEALVPKLKALAHPLRAVIAFGPHVHVAKLVAAQAAGCDEVMTRGQFDAQMETLLTKYLQAASE